MGGLKERSDDDGCREICDGSAAAGVWVWCVGGFLRGRDWPAQPITLGELLVSGNVEKTQRTRHAELMYDDEVARGGTRRDEEGS
jgi:hypothetical protein